MADTAPNVGAYVSLAKGGLQHIFDALKKQGYTLVGPTIKDEAIVCDEIEQVDDLPIGWTDRQETGSYRLVRRKDEAWFGYVVGPHSWKKFLYPPRLTLFEVERNNGSFSIIPTNGTEPQYAFIGARACDVQAITVQDKVFLNGPFQDHHYKARRQMAFILAVNCTEPGGTCFCASMRTGPKVSSDFDLALTELDDVFLVEVGSEMGRQVLTNVDWRPAGAFELQAARRAMTEAENKMGRHLDTSDLPNLLYQNLENAHWDAWPKNAFPAPTAPWSAPPVFARRSRTSPISPVIPPNAGASGTPASPSSSAISTAAASAARAPPATVNG
jgi:hypothetical protein